MVKYNSIPTRIDKALNDILEEMKRNMRISKVMASRIAANKLKTTKKERGVEF